MCKDCLNNGLPLAYKRGEANQVQSAKQKGKNKSVGWESRQSRKKVKHTVGFWCVYTIHAIFMSLITFSKLY